MEYITYQEKLINRINRVKRIFDATKSDIKKFYQELTFFLKEAKRSDVIDDLNIIFDKGRIPRDDLIIYTERISGKKIEVLNNVGMSELIKETITLIAAKKDNILPILYNPETMDIYEQDDIVLDTNAIIEWLDSLDKNIRESIFGFNDSTRALNEILKNKSGSEREIEMLKIALVVWLDKHEERWKLKRKLSPTLFESAKKENSLSF